MVLKVLRSAAILLSTLIISASCVADDENNRSEGCGQKPPTALPTSIKVDGQDREFILVLPTTYDSGVAHRLIFAFHGRSTPNTRVRKYYRIEQNSIVPTIFVYPAGLIAANGKYSWYTRSDPRNHLRDFALFDTLLASFSRDYCIDRDQVFAVGHSLGGSFANSLGCARGSVIRGVGTVAGRIWDIKCSGPAAAMIMHNPNDDLVPVARGLKARDRALAQNKLEPSARPCEPRGLNCECYGTPQSPNPVIWCPHSEDYNRRGKFYPHLWPQNAGAAIMEFFYSLQPTAE